MSLRDIIRGTKRDAVQSGPLAKLAALAIAQPANNVVEDIPTNAALDRSNLEPATANLANATNEKTLPALIPFHFEFFNLLYGHLKKDHHWSEDDYQAWFEDLNTDPDLTLNCLEALHYSLMEGRLGAMEQKDWGRSIRLYKGLTVEQSKITNLQLLQRQTWDDRRLCVECKHLIAFSGAWKCGNWQQAGLTTNLSGSGLSWHLITLLQRCNGFSAQ